LNRYEVHKHCPRQSLDKGRFLLLQSLHTCHPWQYPAGVKTAHRLFLSTPLLGTIKTKERLRQYPPSKRTKSQPGLEPIRGSQTLPTAEFGQRQIFAPAKSAYMPSLAIPRRGQNSPKAVFINSSPTYGAQNVYTQPYYLLQQLPSHHKHQ